MWPKIHRVDGKANAVLKKKKRTKTKQKSPPGFYYYINKDCGTFS